LLNLTASLLLPFIVPEAGPPDELRGSGWKGTLRRCVDRVQIPLAMLWAIGHGVFAVCLFSTLYVDFFCFVFFYQFSKVGTDTPPLATNSVALFRASRVVLSSLCLWAFHGLLLHGRLIRWYVYFHFLLSSYRFTYKLFLLLLTHRFQLGEAILLESPKNTQTNRRSILLADARPQHDDEQQQFLVGRDDEEEDGDDGEGGDKEEEEDEDEEEEEDKEDGEESDTEHKQTFKDQVKFASSSRASSLEQVRPSLERHRSHRGTGSRGGGDDDDEVYGTRMLLGNAAASVSSQDIHSHSRHSSLGRNSLSAGDEERNAADLDGRKSAGLSSQSGVILVWILLADSSIQFFFSLTEVSFIFL
jgi:hypothetical protein